MGQYSENAEREQWDGQKRRLMDIPAEIIELRQKIDELEEHLEAAMKQGEEILTLYENLKFFIRLLWFIERVAIGIAKLGAAAGILWAIWKYGILAALDRGE